MEEMRQLYRVNTFCSRILNQVCLTASNIPNQVHSITATNRLNEKVFNGDCAVDTHVCTGNIW